MATVITHIRILAEDDPSAPDGVKFKMQDKDGCDLGLLVFDKAKLGMGKKDVHNVYFHLVQTRGMTLEFAHSKDKALWVEMGDATTIPKCPTQQPSAPNDIFYATHSTPNLLKATNTNPTVQYFSFTLNFTDPTSPTPNKLIPYDPGGSNQNGGVGVYDYIVGGFVGGVAGAVAANLSFNALAASGTVFYALVGAAIGTLAAFVLRNERRNRT